METLQKSLAIKTAELERKNAEANEKLRLMVQEQQEAESKKKASETLQAAVAVQNTAILERKRVVELDLSKAEPAVREAEQVRLSATAGNAALAYEGWGWWVVCEQHQDAALG